MPANSAPDWVPEKYLSFFHRSAGNTAKWRELVRALGFDLPGSGGSFALVVGVSKYPNMSGASADLVPARTDVEKIVGYIESDPENFDEVVILLDEQVSSDNLEYFLTRYFPRRLRERPNSRFLFAYSGHGMTEENGRGYLLTSAAKNLSDRWGAGIPMTQLRAQLQEIVESGFQVLVLINACYSVDFHRMSFSFGEQDVPIPTQPGAHVITAGGAGEMTWHDPTFGIGSGQKGSIFFEAIIAALNGGADKLPKDGIVSIGELQTYVTSVVKDFTDKRQNPLPGDLLSPPSTGGFFFLDRAQQVQQNQALALQGRWWPNLSFGAPQPSSPQPQNEREPEAYYAARFFTRSERDGTQQMMTEMVRLYTQYFGETNPVIEHEKDGKGGILYSAIAPMRDAMAAKTLCEKMRESIDDCTVVERSGQVRLEENWPTWSEGAFVEREEGWVYVGKRTMSGWEDRLFLVDGPTPWALPAPGNTIYATTTANFRSKPLARSSDGTWLNAPSVRKVGQHEQFEVRGIEQSDGDIWAKVRPLWHLHGDL